MTRRLLRPAAVAAAGLLLLAACRPATTPESPATSLPIATAASEVTESADGDVGYPRPEAGGPASAYPGRGAGAPADATGGAGNGGTGAGSGGDGSRNAASATSTQSGGGLGALLPLIDHGIGPGAGADGGPHGAPAGASPESDPVADPCAGIAQRDGEQLVLDGQPFTFFGVNVPYLLDDGMPDQVVEEILADLSVRGVNTVRVWFSHEDDPERFARVLDLGTRNGIRFVVTLEDNVFEGRDWFFGDEDEKSYRPHLARTVERFKDRPEVLMWEVVNEPNCGDRFDDDCLKTIKDWLTMSSRMVKAIDTCHLVTTGMIGAGNYENEWANYRRIHKRDSIDVASSHRRSDEDRPHDIEQADEAGRPLVYGEIYDIAYDRGCSPLEGGAVLNERAERVKDDLRDSIADGIDGYLLWDYAFGQVELEGGDVKHYCGEHGFERDDPLWDKLEAEPELPAPVPWRGE